MAQVHIDVSLKFVGNAKLPKTGDVEFTYSLSRQFSTSRSIGIDQNGNIYIGDVPSDRKIQVTFHALTKTLESSIGKYEMRFRPAHSASELLWISNDRGKPQGPLEEEDAFSSPEFLVDGRDSSVSVVITKSKLPSNWDARAYVIGMEAARVTGPVVQELVRCDPQIRNGSPPGISRIFLAAMVMVVAIFLGALYFYFA